MPTPLGHALGGLIVGLALPARADNATPRTVARRDLIICTVAACLPDLDFLWGRHNMETHSLGFALLVGVAIWAGWRSPRLAIAAALAVASHVLFDWLGSDDSPPLGVMALWPLTGEYYFAHAYVFEAISRRYWLPGFVQHNTLAVLRELAILLPVVAVLAVMGRRPARPTSPTRPTRPT